MKPLPVASIAIALGVITVGCSREPTEIRDQDAKTAELAVASIAPEGWSYSSYKDKMTEETTSYAWVKSNNTVELKFPYEGTQRGELTIHDRGGVDFGIEKGQIECRDSCLLFVKFDDAKATEYRWYASGDERRLLNIYDKAMLARLTSANHMTLRVFFYQNGFQDFEFTVAGLKPFPKADRNST
ncbi:hypothetical protein ACEN9H_23320 [Massilia cellulosiltytica]|uniref:hypothetical protein n=1 Tax=Massilia cellulosiltytica TaxID=2683234 RepID=UPI0039B6A6B2